MTTVTPGESSANPTRMSGGAISTAHVARIDAGIRAAEVPFPNAASLLMGAARAKARQFVRAIEPSYDWGSTFIERIDMRGEGPGRFLELQWFGINATLFFGRTPKAHVGGRSNG